MRKEIISVKVANRVLRYDTDGTVREDGLSVFPFERFYLTKNPELIPRIFKYYLSMPLNDVLLEGINQIFIHEYIKINIERDDKAIKPKKHEKKLNCFSFIENLKEWSMIVPSRVATVVEGDFILYVLDYVMMHGLSPNHNKKPNLPQIKIHTPKSKPSILCGRCTKVTEMYNGDCSPGTNECSAKHRIIIDKKKIKKKTGSEQ